MNYFIIKKQKKTNVKFLLPLFIFILFTCCDSFVDVDLPQSQLTKDAVFQSSATANAAVTDIYSRMRDQGILTGTSLGLSNSLGNYADEFQCYALPTDSSMPFFTNSLLSSNSNIANYWNTSYNYIYASNAVIEGLENSSHLNKAEKEGLKGEALFIRALMHFYLINLFGSVPYVTSTDFTVNNTVKKNSPEFNYDLLLKDLEEAAVLLPQEYRNSERTRPNKYGVLALLARAYLYNRNWEEASNTVSAVLNQNSLYQLESQLTNVFLKKSKETIWQFQPLRIGKNTDEAATFIFTSGPPPLVSLTADFIDSLETGDLRRTNWIKGITGQGQTWYHAYKYRLNNAGTESLEYSVVLRLAEQYLIRAEARAQQGDLIGAKEDLNKIRSRAGLNNTSAISKEQILKAVAKERRKELFSEYGHRFFDLKRTGEISNILILTKPGWNAYDVMFPIPQNELNVNPNLLPQNEGY
ncbi:RagB/SusD family nutrient uptake outer membrane protein [Flavobacterium chungangensis]|uniref:RagB/SusD family nutrient uptake outer membrane protein n=1 Tax=Flavobacterium chungangensis TaxID=2708132 RepID=A0ABV8ZIK5_9FLAO